MTTKKSASIHQLRRSEAKAIDTGRNIVTTYYETAEKAASMRVIRSMHAATAVPNVIRHMQTNDYKARVAAVWDKSRSLLLVEVTLNVVGEMNVIYYVDPITGKKLRPQPGEAKKEGLTEKQFDRRMNQIMAQLTLALESDQRSNSTVDSLVDDMTKLRVQRRNN